MIATEGWTQTTTLPVVDAIQRLTGRGVRSFVYTDVSRDGKLTGPDLEAVERVADAVRGRFLYSGGIGSLDDLRALAQLRQVEHGRRDRRQVAVREEVHRRRGPGRARRGVDVHYKRVIPCMDVDNGRVVKGTRFIDIRDAGDPVELAAHYDAQGADELVFLDITATSRQARDGGRAGATSRRRRVRAVHDRRRRARRRGRPRGARRRRRQGQRSTPPRSRGPS